MALKRGRPKSLCKGRTLRASQSLDKVPPSNEAGHREASAHSFPARRAWDSRFTDSNPWTRDSFGTYDVPRWLKESTCNDFPSCVRGLQMCTNEREPRPGFLKSGADVRNSPSVPVASPQDLTLPHDAGVELPPSPSSSSQQHVPWTATCEAQYDDIDPACVRGRSTSRPRNETSPRASRVNGVLAVSRSGGRRETFKVEVAAQVYLIEESEGGYALRLPSLPLQGGDGKGTLLFTLLSADHGGLDEQVRHCTPDWNIEPLDEGRVAKSFRLDEPFVLKLLLYERIRVMHAKHLRIGYDISAAREQVALDGQITFTATCIIQSLNNLAFWADHVQLALFIRNGPSGTHRAIFAGSERNLHLHESKQADPDRPARVDLICPVQEMDQPLVLSWEAKVGNNPWLLPQISLEEVRLPRPILHATAPVSLKPRESVTECPGGDVWYEGAGAVEASNDGTTASPPTAQRAVVGARWYRISAMICLLYLLLRGVFPDALRAFEKAAAIKGAAVTDLMALNPGAGGALQEADEVIYRDAGGRIEDTPGLEYRKHMVAEAPAETPEVGQSSHWLRDMLDHSLGWRPMHT